MRAEEFLNELVNKEVFAPGWSDSTTILNGRFQLEAQVKEKYNGNKYLEIEVLDPTKQTRFPVANAKFEIKKGWLFSRHLEAAMINVFSQYQRQGIATAIYQYVRKLGNTIKPSSVQLGPGKAMWQSFKKNRSIDEVVLMPGLTKDEADMPGKHWLGQSVKEYTGFKPLFQYAGNQIYQYYDRLGNNNYYFIVNNDKITAVMTTEPYYIDNNKGVGEQVVGIQSIPENKLKLVDLYHLMILKGKTLVSDYIQSPGGQQVWMKLAKLPGIRVRAWDHKNRKYIRTPMTDVYVDPEDDKQMAEKSRMQHVLLIGTRK